MEDITVQKVVDTVFVFPSPAVRGSKCRIRIFVEEDTQTVVIASQIPESAGTSITNMFEEVATEVWRASSEHFSSIDLRSSSEPIWVQHYPAGSLHLENEELLHLVTFDQDRSGMFTHPHWTQIDGNHDQACLVHQLLMQ